MKPDTKPLSTATRRRFIADSCRPGTRLPTHRTLAADERISLATATRVYRELEAIGLVSSETGRGTFVRDISAAAGARRRSAGGGGRCSRSQLQLSFAAGAGDALREALRRLAMAGILNLICATSLMPDGSPNAKLSPAI